MLLCENGEDEGLIHLSAVSPVPDIGVVLTRRHAWEFPQFPDDRLWQNVGKVDLSMVKAKILDPEEGLRWNRAKADFVEIRYRQFLYLMVKYQRRSIVPTRDVDAFWHYHILDTLSYSRDCELVAGTFIHHFPYFGMRGEEDAQNLVSSFEATKELYFEVFGEGYCVEFEASTEIEMAGKCVKCGSGPVKCHHPPTRCR